MKGKPRGISVVSAVPGAKNTLIGCLNFTWYDTKRKRVRYKQTGRGGLGTIPADKGVKALVARVMETLEDGQLYAVVRLNGKLVYRPDFDSTPVPDGAEILLLPLIAGG